MKKQSRKLQLNKVSIRLLTEDGLQRIAGGITDGVNSCEDTCTDPDWQCRMNTLRRSTCVAGPSSPGYTC